MPNQKPLANDCPGGPSDPDLDPSLLLGIVQSSTCSWLDDHLVIRGLHRWVVSDGRQWALADTPMGRIDKDTFEALRLATRDGVQLVINRMRYVLACTETNGVTWAVLEPASAAVGGPSDPDPPERPA